MVTHRMQRKRKTKSKIKERNTENLLQKQFKAKKLVRHRGHSIKPENINILSDTEKIK